MQGMAATLTRRRHEGARHLLLAAEAEGPRGEGRRRWSRRAQTIYRAGDPAAGIPACSACHAPSGAGVPKNYPRLAGQHADYTYAQLKAFKAGERGADKDGKDINGRIMATIAARMTDAQMRAVAEFTQAALALTARTAEATLPPLSWRARPSAGRAPARRSPSRR